MMTKKALGDIVGRNLLKYRTEHHLTQEEVAEKAGISTSFYANLERGKKSMSIMVLRNLADALNVSTDSLLYGERSESHVQNIVLLLDGRPEPLLTAAEQLLRTLTDGPLGRF